MTHSSWSKSVFPDWENDQRHDTVLVRQEEGTALIERTLDEERYSVRWHWSSGRLEQTETHEFTLFPGESPDQSSEELAFSVGFAAGSPGAADFEAIVPASVRHWASFGRAAVQSASLAAPIREPLSWSDALSCRNGYAPFTVGLYAAPGDRSYV